MIHCWRGDPFPANPVSPPARQIESDHRSQKGEGRRYPEFSALVEGGTGDLGDGWDGVRRLERGVLLGQIINQIKGLPIRTQHMMGLYYFGGYTMREIGKIFDWTDSWVHQVLRTAINQIKRRLT